MTPTQTDHDGTLADTAQRVRAIKAIAGSALVVSVVYAVIHGLLGYLMLMAYSAFFAACYGAVLACTHPNHLRVAGIALMGCGTIHVAGIGVLFVPPHAGTHTFLLLVPIFSLIAIDARDRIWRWTYTLLSMGLIVYFEWVRETLVPLLSPELDPSALRPWRAAASFLTVALVVGVFGSVHRDLYRNRKELQIAYDRSERLLRRRSVTTTYAVCRMSRSHLNFA